MVKTSIDTLTHRVTTALLPAASEALETRSGTSRFAPNEAAASARELLISSFFHERVPEPLRGHVDELLRSNPLNAPNWVNVFWFIFAPPTAVLHIFGGVGAKWRSYGAGIPFYVEGNLDSSGYAKVYVGWGVGFISVDVLGGNANAILEAFPGAIPPPERPHP